MSRIRALKPDEVELRLARTIDNEKGLKGVYLLYKTARTDAKILDETFGWLNWENSFQDIKGVLYCTITVHYPDGHTCSKSDCGTESNIERDKGAASDAFKRAGFKFGIGRELYSAPDILVPIKDKWDKWEVERMEVDTDREIITTLVISNRYQGTYVWHLGDDYFHRRNVSDPEELDITDEELEANKKLVSRLFSEAAKLGYSQDQVRGASQKSFGKSPFDLSEGEVDQALELMKKKLKDLEARQEKLKKQNEAVKKKVEKLTKEVNGV